MAVSDYDKYDSADLGVCASRVNPHIGLLGFTPKCNSLANAMLELGLPPKYLHLTKMYYESTII